MQIYNELMDLVNDTEFFYRDQVTPFGTNVRIFLYHFASYSDWLKPSALESRGIMFEMDDDKPVRIMSRPMEKFFNLNEHKVDKEQFLQLMYENKLLSVNNDQGYVYDQLVLDQGINVLHDKFKNLLPFDLDVVYAAEKMDGSLISTYIDNNVLFMKSKGSVQSNQSDCANSLIISLDHKDFYNKLKELAELGYTANLEYISPENRVVVPYQKEELVLLNVRNNITGDYIKHSELVKDNVLNKYLVDAYDFSGVDFIDYTKNLVDSEGYIFKTKDNITFKLKSDWYVNLHRAKDNVSSNKSLFQLIVDEQVDDVKSLFVDSYSLEKINTFEMIYKQYIQHSYNSIVNLHKKLSGFDRKKYAMESQIYFKTNDQDYLFPTFMNMHTGLQEPENLINQLKVVFMKYHEKFVPSEYVKVKSDPDNN